MRTFRKMLLAGAMSMVMAGAASAADPLKGQMAPIQGGSLYYEVMGSGNQAPLVLITGGPGLDHRYMHGSEELWKHLSVNRPIIFYDQRGTGRTTSTIPVNKFTVDLMVADLEALRVKLGVPRISLLGHSWGGTLAMAYAVRYPEHVSHLVLIGAGSPNISKHEALMDKVYPEIMSQQVPDDSPAGQMGCKSSSLNDYAAMLYYDQRNSSRIPPEDDSAFSEEMCTAVMLDAMKIDLFPKLRTLNVPTLVTNGRFDVFSAPTVAYAISKAIPGAKLVYFEHSGHDVYEEEPDRFELVVSQFLDH